MAPGEDKLNRGSESSTGFCFPPNLLEGWPHESLGIPGTPWLGKLVQEQVQGIPPRNRVHGRGLLCIFSFHGAPPAISSRSKHATCVGMWHACTLSASEMYAVKNEHSEPSTDKDLLWVHLGTLFKLGGKKKKDTNLRAINGSSLGWLPSMSGPGSLTGISLHCHTAYLVSLLGWISCFPLSTYICYS